MRILIAEDDAVSRRVLEATLQKWGYEVEVTADGTSAWGALDRADCPHLLILDWMMPGVDGTELCARLRARDDGSSFYILLLTAKTQKEDIVAGLRAGADDYITKPFHHEELRARVETGRRIVQLQQHLAERIVELEQALAEVQQLTGLLPICAYCKRIREGETYWQAVENYISGHSQARFSHAVCPDCYEKVVKPQLDELQEGGEGGEGREGGEGMVRSLLPLLPLLPPGSYPIQLAPHSGRTLPEHGNSPMAKALIPDSPDSEPAPSPYEIEISEAGPARKRLSITVPAAMIDDKIEGSMGTLAAQTQIPGFRKGRAPRSLLERRFGKSVRDETKNQVIADAYANALETHALKPVSEPEPVDSIDELDIKAGQPFSFAIEVEVVPEFELPDLDGIEIKKPTMEVTEDHIDQELKRQCTQIGEVISIDKDFEEGDRVVGPGDVTKDDDEEPFFTHDTIDIIVPPADGDGGGHVLGLLVDDVVKTLKGAKVGDKLVFETVGPASHELEHVRGATVRIQMQVREGQRIVPAPVETVLEQYGMASEDVLREQIRLALEQRRDQEQRSLLREQVCEHLVKVCDFELPEKLSQAQAGRLLERQRLEMMYRGGLSGDEVETRLAEMRAETELQSSSRLKLSFILHRLAQHFEVRVTDQEINGRIAAIAMQRGERPEKLRAELIQSGGIEQVATQVREHKAADRVIDQARVDEITGEDWTELVKSHRAEAESRKPAATTKKKTGAKKSTTKKKTSKKA